MINLSYQLLPNQRHINLLSIHNRSNLSINIIRSTIIYLWYQLGCLFTIDLIIYHLDNYLRDLLDMLMLMLLYEGVELDLFLVYLLTWLKRIIFILVLRELVEICILHVFVLFLLFLIFVICDYYTWCLGYKLLLWETTTNKWDTWGYKLYPITKWITLLYILLLALIFIFELLFIIIYFIKMRHDKISQLFNLSIKIIYLTIMHIYLQQRWFFLFTLDYVTWILC